MRKHHNERTSAHASIRSSDTTDHESTRHTEDRIRQRAFERYQARGGEDGHDMDDWFEAEREVEGRSAPPDSSER